MLPYLATQPVISYNPETCTLTTRLTVFYQLIPSDKVYITKVLDTKEGLELFRALIDAINATWDYRKELVAMTTRKHPSHLLDKWTLLPQTNYKKCGEATCMAFTCDLLLNDRELEDCSPLNADETFADRRATLPAMLI